MKYSEEFKEIVEAYKKTGLDERELFDPQTGALVIDGNQVLGKNETRGLHIDERTTKEGVNVVVRVDKGANIKRPVHLCFGVLKNRGRQVINSEFFIGEGARVSFIAHCSFPNAERVEHIMDSLVHVARGGVMKYIETHYHSEQGGTKVYPRLRGEIGEGAQLFEEFKLTTGRVGLLNIDYELKQLEKSVCEIIAKVYGRGRDRIDIRDSLHLNGAYAKGTAKTRVVLTDRAEGNVLGEIEGNAPYTRGHIDCQEVVQGDKTRASSTPIISVKNPLATVTHEAAIGRINRREIETLMARGLSEEEAINAIVRGLLR